jgi:hypothetical protein
VDVLLEAVFSVGSTPRLYNEDTRPAELMIGDWRKLMRVCSSVVKKRVARVRLRKEDLMCAVVAVRLL